VSVYRVAGAGDGRLHAYVAGIQQCNALSATFQAIDKIDTIVLPLPYNQVREGPRPRAHV
jgi:hypothetical protein